MQTFRWGIIGPGSIAHQFAQALAGTAGGELYAVASRDLGRSQKFAENYGAKVSYGDYQALIDDPKVDIIYIATPHSHHYEVAARCLQAEKPILLEKPLTINAAQTEALIALSQQHQVLFQEALWSRFMPCFVQVKKWLSEGRIGDLHYITSQIGFGFLHREGHRLLNTELGGGAILDLGVYSISLSQFLLGENPSQIQATGVIDERNIDLNTSVNMLYPSSVISQFTCTIAAQCSNTMTLHGTEGAISLPANFWNGQQAVLMEKDKAPESLTFEHPVNGFEFQIQGCMQAILKGQLCADVMSHDDSLAVMKTMDEIRQQIGLNYDAEIEALS